ncbi:class I SAM-dependent methyltransferase [Alkalibacterium sp.]|nr:MAG: class I SAM-dependent methyltransferase [Alkalibacterium sp.]
MTHSNDTIKKRYNRVSGLYDSMDRMMKDKWRKDLLKDVSGKVLEVGIGTGKNLHFYSEDVELTGVDFSPGMMKKAKGKVEESNLPYPVTLREMDIQQMDFPDNSFDYVVSTCVFCSVPDPVKGLKELKRVCKPDGEIIMLEHMRSDNRVAGKIMDVLNPIPVSIWGANINRDTLENIRKAGLVLKEKEDLVGTVVRKLKLTPE